MDSQPKDPVVVTQEQSPADETAVPMSKPYTMGELVLAIGFQVMGITLLVLLSVFLLFKGFGDLGSKTALVMIVIMLHFAAILAITSSLAQLMKAPWAKEGVIFASGAIFGSCVCGFGFGLVAWAPLAVICMCAIPLSLYGIMFYTGLPSLPPAIPPE
jgi:hypothetical protein